MPLAEVIAGTTQTVEGVKSARRRFCELARRLGVEMPITEVIAAVLQDGLASRRGRAAAGQPVGQARALWRLSAARQPRACCP